jgi:hypothetical protein
MAATERSASADKMPVASVASTSAPDVTPRTMSVPPGPVPLRSVPPPLPPQDLTGTLPSNATPMTLGGKTTLRVEAMPPVERRADPVTPRVVDSREAPTAPPARMANRPVQASEPPRAASGGRVVIGLGVAMALVALVAIAGRLSVRGVEHDLDAGAQVVAAAVDARAAVDMPTLTLPTVTAIATAAPAESAAAPQVTPPPAAPEPAPTPKPSGGGGNPVRQAQQALDRGDVGRAIELAQKATQADPSSAEAWLTLGAAYEAAGKGGPARSAYRSCAAKGKGDRVDECRALMAQ